jgi:hypothetical protein
MVDLIKPSIKRLRRVFMWSDYKYVGPTDLSIIVKGICVTILPGDRIKKFFLPFFMKRYKEYLQLITESPIDTSSTPIQEVLVNTPTEQTIVNEEFIPTPIVDEPSVLDNVQTRDLQQKKSYPYIFKGRELNSALDVKTLLKEELQTLAIELGIPSDARVKELREKINTLLLKKK